MTKEILTSENLVEIYENLNEFAQHNQNLGGQRAIRLIKSEWDLVKHTRTVVVENEDFYKGYDKALRETIQLLHETFVP